ncbi:MAG: pilus assembly protein [Rhodospirillaceae bacterium]
MPSRPLLATKIFARSENGSATVEFAILFPVIISLIIGACWLAIYAVAVGNVQQLTYEVARQTLHYRTAPRDAPDLCSHIGSVIVPRLAASFPVLDPARLSTAECVSHERGDWVSLTLRYDASGNGFAPIMKIVNNGGQAIVGRAVIMGG